MKFSHRGGEHGRALLRATVQVAFDNATTWEAFADQVSVRTTSSYEDYGLAVQDNVDLHFTESVD